MARRRKTARDRAVGWVVDYCRACRWLAVALLSDRVHAGLW